MEIIKIFVGCSANGEDAESLAVLEYSLRKYTSQPVDIVWMKLSRDPSSFWHSNFTNGKFEGINTSMWATPFSGCRWMIPAYCNFEGKAIYMDSDMIILDDIAKLWNQEFENGKVVMAKGGEDSWRYCVCLWDCKAAKEYLLSIERLRSIPEAHQRMMAKFSQNKNIVQPFEGNWNCIDLEGKNINDPDIKIIHYSNMSTQVHLKYAKERLKNSNTQHWFDAETFIHPRQDLQELFDKMLEEAINNGYPLSKYIPNELYGPYNKESQKDYIKGNKWV